MTRLTQLLSLATVAILAACTSKPDNGADTTAITADTSATTTSATATTPAGPSATAASTASSTAAIVPININTATDAQILAIPGVGPRMLREFKEYRPYTSIEQFRREIGKYVDKAEVARLEQYITIK